MSLAKRIKSRMSDLKLTQEALANRADISQGMVYKLVSGKTKSTSKIVQLARALECDIEWLATGATGMIREDRSNYTVSRPLSRNEIKKLIKTLPPREQKAIAFEIMKELL